MAFSLVQAGTNLYSVNPEGGVSTALTLPTGITMTDTRIPRFARFQNAVIVVNTPSRPLVVDPEGLVRVLTPLAPSSAAVLTGANGGTLSGRYNVKYTFIVLDTQGNLISESDYAPLSNTVTIASKYLRAASLALSTDTISARRLYRTTNNGSVYFQWIDVDGNTAQAVQDDKTDAGLSLIAAGARGTAPDLVLIAAYNGRLWGVGRTDGDHLNYTEAGTTYGWSLLNTLLIPHVGDDRFGITALAPRRDCLGVGRRNQLLQVVGNTTATIKPINVSENLGILSQESVVIYRDVVFFLWRDGVYAWDSNGVRCLSDEAGVRTWFVSNSYFNRGMFSRAFAVFDPVGVAYRLFLCSAGQNTPDRWVEYNLKTGKFYGPHTTDAFTPSCALQVRGTNDQPYPMIGSRDGYLSQDVETRTDWSLYPIHFKVTLDNDADEHDHEKYFGQFIIQTHKEDGGTVTITPSVGDLDDETVGDQMEHDLTVARERLDRIGQGKRMTVMIENKEIDRMVTLYGYEVDPVRDVGQR
jgi:hypothetical protein